MRNTGRRGALLGEVSFPALRPGVVNIDHVFVDPGAEGQGVAGQLLEQVCAALRRTSRSAVVTCSYARRWFGQHQGQDVLAKTSGDRPGVKAPRPAQLDYRKGMGAFRKREKKGGREKRRGERGRKGRKRGGKKGGEK